MFKDYDTISGKEGSAFIQIDGKNEELFRAKSVELKLEISKGEVKTIGRRMAGSKASGMKGTGTLKIYYGYPLLAELLERFKKTGKPFYFDLLVVNNDPASSSGVQRVLAKDCLMDGLTLAKLDSDSDDPLEDEISFTFGDYDTLDKFKNI